LSEWGADGSEGLRTETAARRTPHSGHEVAVRATSAPHEVQTRLIELTGCAVYNRLSRSRELGPPACFDHEIPPENGEIIPGGETPDSSVRA